MGMLRWLEFLPSFDIFILLLLALFKGRPLKPLFRYHYYLTCMNVAKFKVQNQMTFL